MAKAAKSDRGRLTPMHVSEGFRAFALEQLSEVRGLRDRVMFGGVGLYADDTFFGIVAADVLYFKVDDSTRGEYDAAGARPFQPYADRPMTMQYYSVPVSVLEDAETLVTWANRAITAARTSAAGAKKKGKRIRQKARRNAVSG